MTSEAQRQLADRVRADRQVWRDLVAEVGRERMMEPGPMGEWTFKDMFTDYLHDEHLPDVRAWLGKS